MVSFIRLSVLKPLRFGGRCIEDVSLRLLSLMPMSIRRSHRSKVRCKTTTCDLCSLRLVTPVGKACFKFELLIVVHGRLGRLLHVSSLFSGVRPIGNHLGDLKIQNRALPASGFTFGQRLSCHTDGTGRS